MTALLSVGDKKRLYQCEYSILYGRKTVSKARIGHKLLLLIHTRMAVKISKGFPDFILSPSVPLFDFPFYRDAKTRANDFFRFHPHGRYHRHFLN